MNLHKIFPLLLGLSVLAEEPDLEKIKALKEIREKYKNKSIQSTDINYKKHKDFNPSNQGLNDFQSFNNEENEKKSNEKIQDKSLLNQNKFFSDLNKKENEQSQSDQNSLLFQNLDEVQNQNIESNQNNFGNEIQFEQKKSFDNEKNENVQNLNQNFDTELFDTGQNNFDKKKLFLNNNENEFNFSGKNSSFNENIHENMNNFQDQFGFELNDIDNQNEIPAPNVVPKNSKNQKPVYTDLSEEFGEKNLKSTQKKEQSLEELNSLDEENTFEIGNMFKTDNGSEQEGDDQESQEILGNLNNKVNNSIKDGNDDTDLQTVNIGNSSNSEDDQITKKISKKLSGATPGQNHNFEGLVKKKGKKPKLEPEKKKQKTVKTTDSWVPWIKKTLNKHKKKFTAIGVGLFLCSAAYALYSYCSSSAAEEEDEEKEEENDEENEKTQDPEA